MICFKFEAEKIQSNRMWHEVAGADLTHRMIPLNRNAHLLPYHEPTQVMLKAVYW